jgi:hypothetical protein
MRQTNVGTGVEVEVEIEKNSCRRLEKVSGDGER